MALKIGRDDVKWKECTNLSFITIASSVLYFILCATGEPFCYTLESLDESNGQIKTRSAYFKRVECDGSPQICKRFESREEVNWVALLNSHCVSQEDNPILTRDSNQGMMYPLPINTSELCRKGHASIIQEVLCCGIILKAKSSCTNDSLAYSCFCNDNTTAGEPRSCYCIEGQRRNTTTVAQSIPNDCYQLKRGGIQEKGTYIIQTLSQRKLVVSCDMDTDGGGWTIIQPRVNGSEEFNRDWNDYREGFGTVNFEFWLGNENLHQLTKQKCYTLRIEMNNTLGDSLIAKYDNFTVSGEDEAYQLVSLGSFYGSPGVIDAMRCHESMKFTTRDNDNDHSDGGNCGAATHSGWWFNAGSDGVRCTNGWCKNANLNGVYGTQNYRTGILWGYSDTLWTFTEMKIRPQHM